MQHGQQLHNKKKPKAIDFYEQLLAAQHENGRLCVAIIILFITNLGLASVISNFPQTDIYFVPGVKSISDSPMIWRLTTEDVGRVLQGTKYYEEFLRATGRHHD